jgi:hypothetical protein
LNVPLRKFSVIAENFKANHLILTSSDYSFDAIDFFAGGQNLLTHSPFPTSATPKTQGMVLASLGLMVLIVRRRSYS